jgi:hypothetical protein
MNIEQIFTMQFELNSIQNLILSSNTMNGILLNWIQPNYQYSIMRRHVLICFFISM